MAETGLTRARSMGPVADALERVGVSVARVFAKADLPLRLIDHPDRLIPLRDQFALVEHAARAIGDETMPVWLSAGAGVAWLGPFGRHLQSAATLREAIESANGLIAMGLQSATKMHLVVQGLHARWTYRVTDPATFGRQRNELLAFGYMQDLIRAFTGSRWHADHFVVPDPLASRSAIEQALGADVVGGRVASIVLSAELLELPNPLRRDATMMYDALPAAGDLVGAVAVLIRTSLLLDRRAGMNWVARRLGTSGRSLQRRLSAAGIDFRTIRNAVVRDEACAMLRGGARVTEVADELGFADPAHFTRAFRAWTGQPPAAWRR